MNRIQTSGLNYKIELSPFSPKVLLKKTLTKDLNGNLLKAKFSDERTFDQIKAENENEDIIELGHKISQKNEEVVGLTSFNHNIQEQVQKLNSELSESKDCFNEEIEEVKKNSKKEIKVWKKKLGKERRMRINLEEKVKHATAVENQSVNEKFVPITSNLNTNVTETALSEDTIEEDIIECTICAELIPNFQPTLFFGVEINPACDMCNPPSKTSSENLSNLSKADLERKHNKEDIKPREKNLT